MATNNPFRQRLDRKKAHLKTVVWQANDQGKDSSLGKTDFALSDEYLWLAYDFCVPLSWILSVDELGPGFRVTWKNPVSGQNETAAFCARTMFGYNRKKRDELIAQIKDAVGKATQMPVPSSVAVAEAAATCQRCGAQQANVYDLEWFISVLMYLIKKPSRNILCPDHAKSRLFLVCISNFILGNLGFGLVVSPIINLSNVREVRNKGAISSGIASALIAIGFLPYLLPLWIVAWAIHYAMTF